MDESLLIFNFGAQLLLTDSLMQEKRVSLEKTVDHIEEEARMVLPGIQTLFGFQLIAVFNQGFSELSALDQKLHLVALLCSAISTLCVLTPAAYHRQAEPHGVSTYFCKIGTRLLTLGFVPLMVGISLEIYLITDIILKSKTAATLMSTVLFLMFFGAWFVFPQLRKNHRHQH